ncbi:phosphotransferase [Microbispora sp. NBC_01389]|uniref:phosphotransferase n=1 Tax=Microbispora sp. NBC_01389 TaxID=2903584 RepID=UPI003254997C
MTELTTPTPTITDRELAHVLAAFRTGPAHRVAFLPDGMMNRNWRVDTPDGVFALKQIIDVTPANARRSLNVLGALAAAQVPVCPPRPTRDGDVVAEIDGRAFCLLPWAHGEHRHGASLTPGQAAHLGAVLAHLHIHLAGAGLSEPERPTAKVTDPHAAAGEADRFLRVIDALPEPTGFDADTRNLLMQRKDLIAAHAHHRPATTEPAGPVGWTHGDVQPLNLLWSDGAVTAILDWDRLAPRPLAEEVTRTGQVQFTTPDGRMDLPLVAAFTTGYRHVLPLDGDDLADAVTRLWWKRATDFWQLQWHYDKGDTGPDHLWLTGERLLHWWTRRRDEVTAAFTGHV